MLGALERQRGAFTRRHAIALALALTAGLLGLGSSGAAPTDTGPTTLVQVAIETLEPGHVVAGSDLRWEERPVSTLSSGGLPLDATAATVRRTILAGEVIVAERLFASDELLGPNERSVTIPLPLAQPDLRPGDRVVLVGLLPSDQPWGPTADQLGVGVVLSIDAERLTVAVPAADAFDVVRYLVLGTVEVVGLP